MNSFKNSLTLYRCGDVSIDPAVVEAATELCNQDCEARGLDMAEISVLSTKTINEKCPSLGQALVECEKTLDLPVNTAQLVYCEWTWAHVDVDYKNYMFVSVVIATGPEPYCVQALKTANKSGDDLSETKRIFSVGDVFVLDPRVAHMAAPAHPHNQSLLVLAQWMVRTETDEERESFRKKYAPIATDRDQSSMMDY